MRVNFLHVFGQGKRGLLLLGSPVRRRRSPAEGDDPLGEVCRRILRVLTAAFIVFHLWVLIYLLIFGNFFATILGRLTGALQHTGLNENTPDWRLVCHTVKVNPVVRFLYWNMNYHIEHHMYAAVPASTCRSSTRRW